MDIFKVSALAIEAQKHRINSIASNMANAQSTRSADGGPYKKMQMKTGMDPCRT